MSQPPSRDFEALIEFISNRQQMPHAWGREANDCCSFPIRAVQAMTGRNPCRLKWTNRNGALRVIRRLGGMEKAIDRYFVRIPTAQAMRGDIAGVPDPVFGIHPMIVEGDTLVGPGETGNKRAPRRAMIMAWSATLPKDNPSPAAKAAPAPGSKPPPRRSDPPAPAKGRGK